MRVFITGGTGFFGQAVRAHWKGVEFVTLSRTRTSPGFVTGDVRDFQFPEGKFDYVLHMCLESEGTDRVIRFAEQKKAKMLFTSSGAVYSHTTPYADGKRRAEQLCFDAGAVVARCFCFTGPGLDLDRYAIGNFIRDALKGGPIVVKGNAIRSYLHTSDLAECLRRLLLWGIPGKAYDVGSDRPVDMMTLAQVVRDEINPDCMISDQRTGETSVYLPKHRVCQTIGLREAIRLTAEKVKLAA